MDHYPPQRWLHEWRRLQVVGLGYVPYLCACSPHPENRQQFCVVCHRMRRLRKYCAFFSRRVHIALWNGVSSYLSVLVAFRSCYEPEAQEKVDSCCGYGWGCDAGYCHGFGPFDNQHVYHALDRYCQRRVIFLICQWVFCLCSPSENGSWLER